MSVQANIRRIQVDPANDYLSLSNKVTGGVVILPRGRDIALQIGFYESGIFVPYPSHLGTITAEVRPFSDHGGTALVTASTASIIQIAEGEWLEDTSQHFTIVLPAAQTVSLATAAETDYWLVITAFTTGGCPLTLVSGRARGVNDGGNYSATVPTPGDPNYLTADQTLAAIASAGTNEIISGGYRIVPSVVNGIVTWNAIAI